MSRVEPTELLYGSTAQASDINATNTSWNNATAAGTIAAVNFREEGLDRRVFAQHVVYGSERGTNSFLSTSTLTTSGAGGVTATFDFGTATDSIGPITSTGSSTEQIVVGYSLWATCSSNAAATTILQVSTDNAAWNDIAETSRTKTTRAGVTRATGTFAAKTVWTGTNGTLYFRIRVVGAGAIADFSFGTLYAYMLLQ